MKKIMPNIGFGTFQIEGRDVRRMVRHALEIGYRHIDTAQFYNNEQDVGQALRESSVSPDDTFVTTKIWPDRFQKGVLQSAIDESRRRLGIDQLDLVLLHWPNPDICLEETLDALMDAKEKGLVLNVGLSNYTIDLVNRAVSHLGSGHLMVNQIEVHPYFSNSKVVESMQQQGIGITAYLPLAKGKVIHDPVLRRIGNKYGKSPAQVTLRWLLDRAIAVIPATVSEQHARDNLDVEDFSLSEEDRAEVDALDIGARIADPDFAPQWD